MKNIHLPIIALILFAAFIPAGCTPPAASAPDKGAAATVQTLSLAQTQVAQLATSLAMTQRAVPSVTVTLPVTPVPSATIPPTAGPLVIDDDFSQDVGRWLDCAGCLISAGALYLGPYPAVDSARGYSALCRDCGAVEAYKMAVDVTYVSGASDRGFGFVLWENSGSYVDLEISTWKSYAAWFYDASRGDSWNAWTAVLPVTISSAVRAGRLTNHLEVVVSMQNGKKTMVVSINGRALQPTRLKDGPGRVGLVVGLHSIGVAFDHFHFEAAP